MDSSRYTTSYGMNMRNAVGKVIDCALKNNVNMRDSRGGATYITGKSIVEFKKDVMNGFFGVHAIGNARVIADDCDINAVGGCFCTTDIDPVNSLIVNKGCRCSGKKLELSDASTYKEE